MKKGIVVGIVIGALGIIVIGALAPLFFSMRARSVDAIPVLAGPPGRMSRIAMELSGRADETGMADKTVTDIPALTGELAYADESLSRPPVERKIIRNASLSLEVASFATAEKTVADAAGRLGGFVSSSSMSKDAEGRLSGTIAVRVPAGKFPLAVEEFAGIGKVQIREVSGTDVTEEYVDLEARMRNLESERARLRELFQRTGKVTDILQVERELSRVQGALEQATGRLRLLKDQVSLSTVTLNLYEAGTVPLETALAWHYGRTVTTIVKALLITVRKLVTLATAVIIFAVLWVPLLLLGRFLLRKRRKQGRA